MDAVGEPAVEMGLRIQSTCDSIAIATSLRLKQLSSLKLRKSEAAEPAAHFVRCKSSQYTVNVTLDRVEVGQAKRRTATRYSDSLKEGADFPLLVFSIDMSLFICWANSAD